MSHFNPNNLYVHYNGTGPEAVAAPRRYTLAHFCKPDAMILAIGPEYDLKATDPWQDDSLKRQIVLAEWREEEGMPALFVYRGECLAEKIIDCGENRPVRQFLQAIRYGDRHLFNTYPRFDEATIFLIDSPSQNGEAAQICLGTPANYQMESSSTAITSAPLTPVNWLRFGK